jgi:hypothetical protein
MLWLTGFPVSNGVNDGTRTRDIRDHNAAHYQLCYAHHARPRPPWGGPHGTASPCGVLCR